MSCFGAWEELLLVAGSLYGQLEVHWWWQLMATTASKWLDSHETLLVAGINKAEQQQGEIVGVVASCGGGGWWC